MSPRPRRSPWTATALVLSTAALAALTAHAAATGTSPLFTGALCLGLLAYTASWWRRPHSASLVPPYLPLTMVTLSVAAAFSGPDHPAWVRLVCLAVLVGGALVGGALALLLLPLGPVSALRDRLATPRLLAHLRRVDPLLAALAKRRTGHGRGHAASAGETAIPASAFEAGAREGYRRFGPGYTLGSVFVRRDPGEWARPGTAAPTCPACAVQGIGMDLVWVQDHPEVATVRCSCGHTWRDPAWATDEAAAWALAAPSAAPVAEYDVQDADPGLAYLAGLLRMEAGNPAPAPSPSPSASAEPVRRPRPPHIVLAAVGLVWAVAALAYPGPDGHPWVRVICVSGLLCATLAGLALVPRRRRGAAMAGQR